MCFRSVKGDLNNDPTEQAIRVINTDSPSSPSAHHKEDSEHFLGTTRARQYSDAYDQLRGIGPSAEDPAYKQVPKEDKKKKWDKPSWNDIFRVDGPPLQSYQQGVNEAYNKRHADKEKTQPGGV